MTKASKRLAAEWARAVPKPVKEAQEAVEKGKGRWTLKAVFPNRCAEAFGDMAALMKPNTAGSKTPCPRLFAYGKCKVQRCNCSHSFAREPSKGQGRKFIDWVTVRCTEIKLNPPKE